MTGGKIDGGPVFLAKSIQGGSPKHMSTLNLCTDLLQEFGREKLDDPSFTMTGKSIRKLWSTLGHEMSDHSIRDLVPLFMNHSSAVAHRHYNKGLGHSKAKYVRDKLGEILGVKLDEDDGDDGDGDTILTDENRALLEAMRENCCEEIEAQQKQTEKSKKRRDMSVFNPRGGRMHLTEGEREIIHKIFFPMQKEFLTVTGQLKSSVVIELAKTDDALAGILKSVAERKNIDMGRAIHTVISSLKYETQLWWRMNRANEAGEERKKDDVSSSK